MATAGSQAGKQEVGVSLPLQEAGRFPRSCCAMGSSDLFRGFLVCIRDGCSWQITTFFRKQKCSLLVAWVSVIPCLFMQALCAGGQSQSQPGVRVQPSPDSFVGGYANSSMAPAPGPLTPGAPVRLWALGLLWALLWGCSSVGPFLLPETFISECK